MFSTVFGKAHISSSLEKNETLHRTKSCPALIKSHVVAKGDTFLQVEKEKESRQNDIKAKYSGIQDLNTSAKRLQEDAKLRRIFGIKPTMDQGSAKAASKKKKKPKGVKGSMIASSSNTLDKVESVDKDTSQEEFHKSLAQIESIKASISSMTTEFDRYCKQSLELNEQSMNHFFSQVNQKFVSIMDEIKALGSTEGILSTSCVLLLSKADLDARYKIYLSASEQEKKIKQSKSQKNQRRLKLLSKLKEKTQFATLLDQCLKSATIEYNSKSNTSAFLAYLIYRDGLYGQEKNDHKVIDALVEAVRNEGSYVVEAFLTREYQKQFSALETHRQQKLVNLLEVCTAKKDYVAMGLLAQLYLNGCHKSRHTTQLALDYASQKGYAFAKLLRIEFYEKGHNSRSLRDYFRSHEQINLNTRKLVTDEYKSLAQLGVPEVQEVVAEMYREQSLYTESNKLRFKAKINRELMRIVEEL